MKNLSDKMLQVVLAVLVECSWRISKVDTKFKHAFEHLFNDALGEMQLRKLPKVGCESDLVPRLVRFGGSQQYAEERKLLRKDLESYDPSIFCDDELALMYAIGGEIADFSMLGRGVRTLNEKIWLDSEKEMKKRKLKLNFLCDLEH
jgi:hypothetical protein